MKTSLLNALNIQTGSHCLLKTAEQSRLCAKESMVYQFLGPPRTSWIKVGKETIDNFRSIWLPSSEYVSDIPSKNETVIMRDILSIIVRDEQNKPLIVQKLVCRECPRVIHNRMILPVLNGGMKGITE